MEQLTDGMTSAIEQFGVLDMEQFAGQGSQNVTAADLRFPFYALVQSNSKILDPTEGKYLENARQGMIHNDVTNELFSGKDGIFFVPCYFTHDVKEWGQRGTGKGMIASHPMSILRNHKLFRTNEKGRQIPISEEGNDLVETATHYGLQVNLETGHKAQAIIAMKSTQLKKSKQLNSLIVGLQIKGKSGTFNPARFSQIYKLTAASEKNPSGSYFNWGIEFHGLVTTRPLFEAAKSWSELAPTLNIIFAGEEDGEPVDGETTQDQPDGPNW